MSLVEDLGTVATLESAAIERSLRLQRRWERERARRQSESAEQWEELLNQPKNSEKGTVKKERPEDRLENKGQG